MSLCERDQALWHHLLWFWVPRSKGQPGVSSCQAFPSSLGRPHSCHTSASPGRRRRGKGKRKGKWRKEGEKGKGHGASGRGSGNGKRIGESGEGEVGMAKWDGEGEQ